MIHFYCSECDKQFEIVNKNMNFYADGTLIIECPWCMDTATISNKNERMIELTIYVVMGEAREGVYFVGVFDSEEKAYSKIGRLRTQTDSRFWIETTTVQ